MNGLRLTYRVERVPFCFVAMAGGRRTLTADATDGVLAVSVPYTFRKEPLILSGAVQAGDEVELLLFPHRIALLINGRVEDEEWPVGERLFAPEDAVYPSSALKIETCAEEKGEEPSVLFTFEGAEGWRPGGGVFVGDCMPYRRGEEYHVLYLKDRHHHGSKWGLGAHQWEHLSTLDFKTWRAHPMAVPITDPEEGSICTGSHIAHGGREYLFYTVRRPRGEAAPIMRSVSLDGFHFEKDPSFGFTVGEAYHAPSARDPKVVKGADGLFHMFLTTSLLSEHRGCLAHFVSEDLDTWEDVGAPIYVSPDEHQPECPDYFVYGGRYYLVFSLNLRAHYMVSDKPFSDFWMPEDPIIPCESVPKGAEWEGRLVFTGFRSPGGYGGTLTFKAARARETGELVFEEF